ncbi:hypothetical protein QNM97_11765 [Gordonia sp. L191]|uniref:nuclear transport factor 2 family protein n=1 Tax=Gordonia sp. L191 TaxID=2982699 RepID=UPI0024BF7F56|nr:hypothetical protein [Gordonia sp. L191]WHU49599.1 hypothetical protein QNM97_11765 [Gordonia sp. L191]
MDGEVSSNGIGGFPGVDIGGAAEALWRREPIFHRWERGFSRAEFDRMTDVDFSEVGASGSRYDREYVWSVLLRRHATASSTTASADAEETWRVEDFAVRSIAPDTHLVTYTLHQDDRVSRRATIWRHEGGHDDSERDDGGHWVALYHQGTLVPDR